MSVQRVTIAPGYSVETCDLSAYGLGHTGFRWTLRRGVTSIGLGESSSRKAAVADARKLLAALKREAA